MTPPALSRIECPTLLVFAEESLVWQAPTNGVAFEAVPDVDRVTLPGGHWLMFEPPQRLMHEIRRWLAHAIDG